MQPNFVYFQLEKTRHKFLLNPMKTFPEEWYNKSRIQCSLNQLIFMVFLFVDGIFGRLVYDQQ